MSGIEELRERGRGDIPIILGGFIQPEDEPFLKEQGVKAVFGVGSKLDTIVDYIRDLVLGEKLG